MIKTGCDGAKSEYIKKEIERFTTALVDSGILLNRNEALIIAKNVNRYQPDYGFLADVAATREAHKRFGPTG